MDFLNLFVYDKTNFLKRLEGDMDPNDREKNNDACPIEGLCYSGSEQWELALDWVDQTKVKFFILKK